VLKRLIEVNAAEIAGLKDREGKLRTQMLELNEEVAVKNQEMAAKNLEIIDLITD